MTNALIAMLDDVKQRETAMNDEANDIREGYCDGVSGRLPQSDRSDAYSTAWADGSDDFERLAKVMA